MLYSVHELGTKEQKLLNMILTALQQITQLNIHIFLIPHIVDCTVYVHWYIKVCMFLKNLIAGP